MTRTSMMPIIGRPSRVGKGGIGMMIARMCALSLGIILIVAVAWAVPQATLIASFQSIAADPWGLVMLVDLYSGFVLIALVIASFEQKIFQTLLWVLPIFVLGNIVTALWVVVRLPRIAARGAAYLHR